MVYISFIMFSVYFLSLPARPGVVKQWPASQIRPAPCFCKVLLEHRPFIYILPVTPFMHEDRVKYW